MNVFSWCAIAASTSESLHQRLEKSAAFFADDVEFYLDRVE